MFPDTGKAFQLKGIFLAMYELDPDEAEQYLDTWITWALECGLKPFEDFAKMAYRHRIGIHAWFQSRIANGVLEAINSLLQAAKAKARGYRNDRTLITMGYLIAGRLNYRLPTCNDDEPTFLPQLRGLFHEST